MTDLSSFLALNRFGLGIGPADADAVGGDPKRWLERQIVRRPAVPPALSRFPSSAATLKTIHEARLDGAERLGEVARAEYRTSFVPEIVARARHHVVTDQPFVERMVLFWSNHFTVSRSKPIVGPTLPAYEREAIRPHVFGRFEDLLLAVVGHPSMLSYLDNDLSVGPRSLAGRWTERSLNENLAREVLELHTVGVDGGYTQADVTELARALTGWTHGGMVRSRGRRTSVSGAFVFRSMMHEPGSKQVLGRTYREAGVDEGRAILRDLARHPATARFVATKLARHFVADEPPAAAVDRLADVFDRTGGDLAAVSRELVHLDEVWADPTPKVKTPYELVVGTLRALAVTRVPLPVLQVPLAAMGQLPFAAPTPQGWPDRAADWLAPEALLRRIEWLRAVAGRFPVADPPAAFLERVIGPVASETTRSLVAGAPAPDAAIALVLASSEFQRR